MPFNHSGFRSEIEALRRAPGEFPIAALAHNLLRWTTLIGLPETVIPTARTLRRRMLTVPGRLV